MGSMTSNINEWKGGEVPFVSGSILVEMILGHPPLMFRQPSPIIKPGKRSDFVIVVVVQTSELHKC